MRDVNRLETPEVLKRNAYRWTEELLAAIEIAKNENAKVRESLWTRYNHKEVRDCLVMMYSGLCCYCESRIGDVAWEHIEHRKPKKRFPASTFSWDNLHLACPKCNMAKSDKWNSDFEILDAAIDHPISDHLGYKIRSPDVIREPITDRGAITVEHADLNRRELMQTRLAVFVAAFNTVKEVRAKERAEGESPKVRVSKRELKRLFTTEHGSVIEFVASSMLDNIA